jgi:hypothetical protein
MFIAVREHGCANGALGKKIADSEDRGLTGDEHSDSFSPSLGRSTKTEWQGQGSCCRS